MVEKTPSINNIKNMGKNKEIERIKMMMSYDMSKTLNENLGEKNSTSNTIEVDEDTSKEIVNAIQAGKTEAEILVKLAAFFKMDVNLVKLALAKDSSVLTKELENAIKQDIKNGANVTKTGMLGKLTKDASKSKAIKEIMTSGSLSETQLINIIERNRNASKDLARKFELKKIKPTTPTPPTPPVNPGVVDRIKKYLKGKYTWKQILKWGLGLGLVGGAIWLACKNSGEQLPDDFPPTPPTDGTWLPCIQKLINNKTGIVETGDNGISVLVKDKNLRFFPNNRVVEVTTGKKGTYKCTGETVTTK